MNIQEIRNFITEKAEEFGAKSESYQIRDNTEISFQTNNPGAYFGLVESEEEPSGPYHDFSLVLFPSDKEANKILIALGVGSQGFKNDYTSATYPGLRRLFSKLTNEKGYCKTDFSDIETSLPKNFMELIGSAYLQKSIQKYRQVLPACQIIKQPDSEEGKKIIAAFVAGYAKLREWATNNGHRKAISEALAPFQIQEEINDEDAIRALLTERKFIVIQGPPGTGKTRIAKKISGHLGAKTFFTQFHAETSNSDFIFGIRPDTDNHQLFYKDYPGAFLDAVKYALNNAQEKVILIIDEINRANLSNVLGPVFYLFEHKMEATDVEIVLSPKLSLKKLPDNFYVIATMNTADRSLAVVDFALRRRFAWYNKLPKIIEGASKRLENCSVNKITESSFFFKEDFAVFTEIFDWYANSNELNLQPGEGYFIADSENEMHNRIRYELFPLVKEYLQEGLLGSAKEEFNNYFSNRIGQSLFE